jgi:rhodanese-related sulfurtransferase
MTQNVATKAPQMSAVEYFKAKLGYEMSPYGLKHLLDDKTKDYVLVDVRSPEEFKKAHIPTALSIPLKELTNKLSSLPKDKTIVTYCGNITCQLAPTAALELAQKGFKVMDLHGGIKEWQNFGFPVEQA